MKSKRHQIILEQLEDRLTPSAYGALWSDPSHLTLSFAPDGTNISGASSNLFSSLSLSASSAAWEQTILRAFQTWAVYTKVNIGVVGDDGSAFGTAGAVQGDTRFGDIRVGAQLLPSPAVATTSFVVPGSTWSGDMVLNTSYMFGSETGQYDLFTVALHEAGHVFGLQDSTDTSSVMYAQYRGVYTGLMATDVALIQ
jgi:predicted Zn-dependent protease